jgi:subtilisin family serine protease
MHSKMNVSGIAPKAWHHPFFSTVGKFSKSTSCDNTDVEFLKENFPLIRKLLPPQVNNSLNEPSLLKQDLNVHLLSTGASILQQLGLTGKNMAVAVLDSGVASVPDLEENLIGSYRLKNGEVIMTLPNDPLGHATAVAGFIAGTGKSSGGLYRGMAPGAKIISVQVANEHGSARYSDLPRAIHWLVKNKDNFKDKAGNPVPLKVINISMGFPEFLPTACDPLARAVKEAWNAGIVVVAAAGNSGPEPMSLVASPGDEPTIIVVGAIDDHGTPDRTKATMADFSSRGPTPEGKKLPTLVAPGANVVSLNVPGSILDRTAKAAETIRKMKDDELYKLLQQDDELRQWLQISEEDLAFSTPQEIHEQVNKHLPSIQRINDFLISLSGTSFACPIVAGGILQVMQYMLENGKDVSPNSVKGLLCKTADKLPGVSEDAQGAGYVNFKRAYDFLAKNP